MTRTTWIALLAVALLVGCGGETGDETPVEDTANNGGKEDSAGDDVRMCAAVRGNGQLIWGHFGSLARLHEHYGTLDGIAGGSSGSITTFLTESMYANPHVWDCGDARCSDEVAGQRIALMYKSLEGYVAVLGGTEEAIAFSQLAPLAAKAQEAGIEELIQSGEFLEAREALLVILNSEDIQDLVNQELIALLTNSPDPEFHVQEVWGMLSGFGSFKADDPRIFVLPGVLDFHALAGKLGRIGSFYAAYGPADGDAWKAFFANCAEQGKGKPFTEIAGLDAGGASCGELFGSMVGTYRAEFVAGEDSYQNRIDDEVGAFLPSLVITSVLEGDAVDTFAEARTNYQNAEDWSLDVKFDDVKFGYWGQQDHLDLIASNPQGYTDLKTQKFVGLGEATYREALSFSPAEPGLARALEIDDRFVSAGGWPDLQPVQVLKNLGCDEVVFLTRQGGEVGGFATGVATLLGMSSDEQDALYDLGGDSAIFDAVSEADARWCTDWNNQPALEFSTIVKDAYNAPVETKDPFFTDAKDPYGNLSADLGLPSCSPGVLP